jgi:hypothetical protein
MRKVANADARKQNFPYQIRRAIPELPTFTATYFLIAPLWLQWRFSSVA